MLIGYLDNEKTGNLAFFGECFVEEANSKKDNGPSHQLCFCGANAGLWERESKAGKTYLSGILKDMNQKITIHKNEQGYSVFMEAMKERSDA